MQSCSTTPVFKLLLLMKWIFNAVDLAYTVIVGGVWLTAYTCMCLTLYDITEVCVCWEGVGHWRQKVYMAQLHWKLLPGLSQTSSQLS